jgi:predicted RNA binding protein YcfA (HicA-like mRNA interferase family)
MRRGSPVDAPRGKVIAALARLGFRVIGEGNHGAMVRDNADGSRTPLTLPGHSSIKGSTLRAVCTQAGIARADFLTEYYRERE